MFREGFNNPSHGNRPIVPLVFRKNLSAMGWGVPPLSVNFFPLGFREPTVRGGGRGAQWETFGLHVEIAQKAHIGAVC